MFRKSIITAALLMTIIAGLGLTTSAVQAQEPLPNIVANVTNDWVEVWGLNTTDVPARLEVYRGADPDSVLVCSQVYEVINGNPWLDCPESGIQAGDRVVLKVSDIQVKDLTVLGFTLNGFDPGVGDFKGTAPAGRTVFVTVCNPDQDCFDGDTTVSSEGNWTVSFGSGVVSPYADFWATIWEDDWDSTQASFIPPPTIEVNHTTNWVSVWGFTESDQKATLEVRSPSSDLKCVGEFELNGSWEISLDCQEQNVNILPGDMVLLEVDDQLVNELVVQPVLISEYNPNEGVIRGTAPEDAYVQVEICNQEDFCIFEEVADLGGGSWEMYFDPTPFDYVGWVAAHLIEPDGDQTIAEYINRVIDVNVSGNWISAWGFGPDDQFARVELWRGPDLLCDGDFELSEAEPWLDCWEEGVSPGDQIYLFVNDEIEPDKEHTVFDLTMDYADLDAGSFTGSGPSGTTVRVEVCPPDIDCVSQEYTLEDTTSWEIFFDSGPFDPDSWFAAFITDEDGDQTMAELIQEEPAGPGIDAYPLFDLVNAWFFPEGETITLLVKDELDQEAEVLYSATALSEPSPYNPDETLASFDLRPFDLLAGQWLIMFSPSAGQVHQIFNLTLDSVDHEGDLVSGTADPFSEVMVSVNYAPEGDFRAEADAAGIWVADYSGQYDLVYGDLIIASRQDEAGNNTIAQRLIVTPGGLVDEIQNMPDDLVSPEIKNSLIKKVENAYNSYLKGNQTAAINKLEALINEIDAQVGNKVDPEVVTQLHMLVQNLIRVFEE